MTGPAKQPCPRSRIHIVAKEVGPSLRRVTASVTKTTKGSPEEPPAES